MTKTKTTRTPRTRTPKPAPVATSPLDVLIAWVHAVTVDTVLTMVATHTAGYTTATRNVGRFTGTRIVAFQNMTMVRNAEWQLDDCQLAALWSVEFPAGVGRVFSMNALPGVRPLPSASSITDAIGIVRGVRAAFNATGHGDPSGKPATASVAYGAKRFAVSGGTVAPVADVAPAKPTRTRTRKTA